MAEAIFGDMVGKDPGLRQAGINARSAGTLESNGHEAVDEAAQVMLEKGLNMNSHRSRHIDADSVDWADVILVMEHKHEKYIAANFPRASEKVHLLSEFAGEKGEIPDPIGCGIGTYRECADKFIRLLSKVLEKLGYAVHR